MQNRLVSTPNISSRRQIRLFNYALKALTVFIVALLPSFKGLAATPLLPQDVSYDPSIPKPEASLGAPLGEWHVRHDQILQYLYQLDAASPRIQLQEIGRTHENRPLLHLTITSAENHSNIESLRQRHLAADPKDANRPGVVFMGYSVHGDEPSGANSALLLAYYLAAAQGETVDQLLQHNVIILDPVLNPDGLARFAQWANSRRGKNLVADPNHWEHVQQWPSGRTNHYWFDLNRDWLLLTHPESKARIREFHRWRPHVVTDFHEMGPNNTYFFQPGVPSRRNPLTPESNAELTAALTAFNAKAMDQRKLMYFTEEGFDDFYYGKGSTYPDALGSIGILYEQASSRGHLQDTINGPLKFIDTIANQFVNSLAILEAVAHHRTTLLQYRTQFDLATAKQAKSDDLAGFLLSEQRDSSRLNGLLDKLQRHHIQFHRLSKDVELEEQVFKAEHSYYVPLNQPQYRLIRSLFSTRKRFPNNTFYDVSNWNIALSHNIRYLAVSRDRWRKVPWIKTPATLPALGEMPKLAEEAVAYGFAWRDSRSPKLLQNLLQQGVQMRVATAPFVVQTPEGQRSFVEGSIMIPTGLEQPQDLAQRVADAGHKQGIPVYSFMSTLTAQGIDLGSSKFVPVQSPNVLLVGGVDMSQYEVGEIWHYFDQQADLPVTIVDEQQLQGLDLSQYSHIILVQGNYWRWTEGRSEALREWTEAGGTLIGQKSANRWLAKHNLLKATVLDQHDIDSNFETSDLSFADQAGLAAKKRIAGAVYEADIDHSHPLFYGFPERPLMLFKNSNMVMRPSTKPFVNAAKYSGDPLRAGYTSDELQSLVGNSAAAMAHRVGKGRVIAIVDDVNFRGYWQGSNRVLSNAVYFSPLMNAGG